MPRLVPLRLVTAHGVLLLMFTSAACQPLSPAANPDAASHTSADATNTSAAGSSASDANVTDTKAADLSTATSVTVADDTKALRLPATPPTEALTIAIGQRLVLPMRAPAERWQLDYDPRFWQRLDHSDQIELIALTGGATDVVQRERSQSGGPAPRRFVYQLHISH